MSQQDVHIAVPVDPDVEAFVNEVETFLIDHAMNPSRFGRESRRDSRFVRDLRGGRQPDYLTRQEVREWMRSHNQTARQAG